MEMKSVSGAGSPALADKLAWARLSRSERADINRVLGAWKRGLMGACSVWLQRWAAWVRWMYAMDSGRQVAGRHLFSRWMIS